MKASASGALAVSQALNRLAREDRGRLLAALISRLNDIQLAEDALQDAMLSAVTHWSRSGVPASAKGWLLQVAYRKAIDRLRRQKTANKVGADMAVMAGGEDFEENGHEIPDERLRLIFTCCHPALAQKSQVALTLRTLGGLSTAEIARAFLDSETAMGQRLSRAQAKIKAAGIPFAVPDAAQWPERLNAVLAVLYLIFNAGYSAGPAVGHDLAEEALFLGRILDGLCPQEAEIEGFLALVTINHARRDARIGVNGATVPIGAQDRASWRRGEMEAGLALVGQALSRGRPGPYQIKAAIAACHCEGTTSDWAQIAMLYGALLEFEPTAIVRLNRAVACAEAGADASSIDGALSELRAIEAALADYQPFFAARAELQARRGRLAEACADYAKAIEMTRCDADIGFLQERMARLCQTAGPGANRPSA